MIIYKKYAFIKCSQVLLSAVEILIIIIFLVVLKVLFKSNCTTISSHIKFCNITYFQM